MKTRHLLVERLGPVPWRRWAALSLVAVVGSLLYGASLALVLPGWEVFAAAVWLALSAGLAWCVLIPVLCRIGSLPIGACCDACLVTMAVGEIVLTAGALLNGWLWLNGGTAHAVVLNGTVVGISNVIMGATLAHHLKEWRVPARRTWTAWMVALNGSGAIFFAIFYRCLHGA